MMEMFGESCRISAPSDISASTSEQISDLWPNFTNSIVFSKKFDSTGFEKIFMNAINLMIYKYDFLAHFTPFLNKTPHSIEIIIDSRYGKCILTTRRVGLTWGPDWSSNGDINSFNRVWRSESDVLKGSCNVSLTHPLDLLLTIHLYPKPKFVPFALATSFVSMNFYSFSTPFFEWENNRNAGSGKYVFDSRHKLPPEHDFVYHTHVWAILEDHNKLQFVTSNNNSSTYSNIEWKIILLWIFFKSMIIFQ